MRVSDAKELFRQLVKEYFTDASVIFANQSRTPKPKLDLVTMLFGNVNRPVAPNYAVIDGELAGHYLSKISADIDFFTHGTPVYLASADGASLTNGTGQATAYESPAVFENTAMDTMLAFADFLNSEYTVEWCSKHDMSILTDGDVQDLTNIVNDTTYEYRARLPVQLYFTHTAAGYTAELKESSIKYPCGHEPAETESVSGDFITEAEHEYKNARVEHNGAKATGFFTEAEITEAKEQKNE